MPHACKLAACLQLFAACIKGLESRTKTADFNSQSQRSKQAISKGLHLTVIIISTVIDHVAINIYTAKTIEMNKLLLLVTAAAICVLVSGAPGCYNLPTCTMLNYQ